MVLEALLQNWFDVVFHSKVEELHSLEEEDLRALR